MPRDLAVRTSGPIYECLPGTAVFFDKAPEHLVQQTRDQLAQLEKDHAATKAALDKLG